MVVGLGAEGREERRGGKNWLEVLSDLKEAGWGSRPLLLSPEGPRVEAEPQGAQ